MSSVHSRDEAQERAALYAVGALTADEATAFEAHLADGCVECRSAADDFAGFAADLAAVAPPVAPPPHLRARVLDRIAAESPGDVFEKDGQLIVRASAAWLPRPDLQIDVKPLYVDAARGYATQLVRIPPGGIYPAHRHGEAEEIYVLEGDLHVSGVEMHAGDYCRAEEGSIHDIVRTSGGCVFIVHSSLHDEMLADEP